MIFKNNIIFYIVCAIFLVAELYYLGAYSPMHWSQAQNLRTEYADLSKEVSSFDKALGVIQATDKIILAKQLARVNAALPSQKKTSGLVNGILATASTSGVILKELEFSPGRISTDSSQLEEQVIDKSQARSVTASVVVLTDLDKFVTFLNSIQQANQLLGVQSLQFIRSPRGGPQASVMMDVYFEPLSDAPINWETVRSITPSEQKILDSLSLQDNFIIPEERR